MSESNRNKTLIDFKLQGALVRRILLHWLGFFVVASVVAFLLQVLSDPLLGLEVHLERLWWTHGPFLVVMLFLLPVFVLDTVKFSNRFAGPIYRLKQTVRTIAQGGPATELQFREYDFWQDLATDFNRMLSRLRDEPNVPSEGASEVGNVDYETLAPSSR